VNFSVPPALLLSGSLPLKYTHPS